MKGLTLFITAFCITSAVIGALHILLPEGSFSKPVKYTFCVCFLCCVLSVFSFSLKSDLSVEIADIEPDLTYASQKAAELTFKTALENAGIRFSDLKVYTSKNVSGGIDIIEVVVYSPDTPQKIIDLIGNNGYEVNVINEDGF